MAIGFFEGFSNHIEAQLAHFAQAASASMIGTLTPIFATCVSIYFFVKAYLFLFGDPGHQRVADVILTSIKIAFVMYFALNTGNYVSYVIEMSSSLEQTLLSALNPSYRGGVFASMDDLWSICTEGMRALWNVFATADLGSTFSSVGFGTRLALLFLILLYGLVTVSCLSAGVGILVVAKVSLTVVLGFGPLFVSLLAFPATRHFFDKWLGSTLSFIFTLVIMAAVVSLFGDVFSRVVATYLKPETFVDLSPAEMAAQMGCFCIMALSCGSIIRMVPGIAQSLVGGMASNAISVAQMLRGTMAPATAAAGFLLSDPGRAALSGMVKSPAYAAGGLLRPVATARMTGQAMAAPWRSVVAAANWNAARPVSVRAAADMARDAVGTLERRAQP